MLVLGPLGCIRDNLVSCGANLCPASQVCVAGDVCANQDQITACMGLADGAPCTPTTSAPGTCQDGVCVQFCGDGVVEAGEQCDDGNTNPADGCDACTLTTWTATAVIGGQLQDATMVALDGPAGIAADRHGDVYIADVQSNTIRKLDASGVISTFAGTGISGPSGDGGRATNAELESPNAVAVDGLGNVFVVDSSDRVRRIDTAGIIATVAGGGTVVGFAANDGPALDAALGGPNGIALDGLGNLYIADSNYNAIRRVGLDGILTLVAGNGNYAYDGYGGQAIDASVREPKGVAVDAAGNVYIAQEFDNVVRKVDANGVITTFAGTGTAGAGGDGGLATAATLDSPQAVATDSAGNLYIANADNVVRKVDANGIITTFAGNAGPGGFAGDGGPAASAMLSEPVSVTADPAGDLFISDSNNQRIRRVDSARTITTVAGTGAHGANGDHGAATSAPLSGPECAFADGNGNLIVSNTSAHTVRRVDGSGTITTVAGNGTPGFAGDGGLATLAEMNSTPSVALDGAGNMYIADNANHRIRRVDAAGVITTVAGNGTAGFSGDGGAATSAQLDDPQGVAIDSGGNLVIADTLNARVRRVDSNGTITTIAGNGTVGFFGDNGPATSAELSRPLTLAFDAVGNLFVSDTGNARIRQISPSGVIKTLAGNGTAGATGDGGLATNAEITPSGLGVDVAGNVYFADSANQRVRRIDTGGTITTVVGTGSNGSTGDGGPAIGATLTGPSGVSVDAFGNMYIAEQGSGRIRRVTPAGTITTVAGAVAPLGMGPFASAHLVNPRAIALGPMFALIAGGASGTVQAAFTASSSVSVIAGRYPQAVATGTLARFRDQSFGTITGVAFDPAGGQVFLTESSANRLHVVTIVDPANPDTWTIAPLANATGTSGFADGVAQTAMFRAPTGLYFDAGAQQLYVADTGNHVVRAIDLSTGVAGATVRTIAGTPLTLGFFGDGGAATSALLFQPQAITRCDNGDLFIADTGNQRIRRVDANGTITTVLGDGTAASSGQGAPSATFPVDTPLGLACDALGDVYVTSTATVRNLPANTDGFVDGNGSVYTIYGGSRDTFPASVTSCLTGVAVVDAMTLQVVDSCTGLLVSLVRD